MASATNTTPGVSRVVKMATERFMSSLFDANGLPTEYANVFNVVKPPNGSRVREKTRASRQNAL
jgi:hypothetical protein